MTFAMLVAPSVSLCVSPSPLSSFVATLLAFIGFFDCRMVGNDDGVLGIDLDEPMHGSARGFAMEDEIERESGEPFGGGPEPRLEDYNMDIGFIIKNLVLAHRDPNFNYKLSDERLAELTPFNLTEEEESIVVETDEAPHDLRLKEANDYIFKPIISVASSLDERGLYSVSDILDTWMSKNAQAGHGGRYE